MLPEIEGLGLLPFTPTPAKYLLYFQEQKVLITSLLAKEVIPPTSNMPHLLLNEI